MIRSRKMDLLCLLAIGCAVMIAVLLLLAAAGMSEQNSIGPDGGQSTAKGSAYLSTDYVEKLFDDTYVHEIDIRLPQVNWDYMVAHAEEEQYVLCDLVIDGEEQKNAAIRPKGNSSLKAIKTQGSDRFSFKIEFDHYRQDSTYYGLDKLALNNLGQDVSCMKDYLTYHMMNDVGIAAPLSSYVHVTLNGEDFGLYLAVEAIEDSFANRNYGDTYGNLYLPECFAIANVTPKAFINMDTDVYKQSFENLGPGERADLMGTFIRSPFEQCFGEEMEAAALHYVGEDPERYRVFFDASVFDLPKEAKGALIGALKTLNSAENPEDAMDLESVINYFVVHNFVNNYDGYTGIFVHNYYLREAEGKLSMIPWDYNLGFGIFTVSSAIKSFLGEDTPYQVDLKTGQAMDDSTGMINYPIDTPTFTVDVKERPLLAAVLENAENKEKYHAAFAAFLEHFFESGRFGELYQRAYENITPYVKSGQTFYTPAQFEKAAEAVHDYCILRAESIRRQLDGRLPATLEGQKENYDNLVDASDLDLASSVTFDSLVFGIRSEDVLEILDAVAGEEEHSTEGVTKVLERAGQDSGEIGRILGRVFAGSSLLQKAVISVLGAPILLILSLITLRIALKRVKKYERRRY